MFLNTVFMLTHQTVSHNHLYYNIIILKLLLNFLNYFLTKNSKTVQFSFILGGICCFLIIKT